MLLAWDEAADADGDVLGYVVRWSVGDASHEEPVTGTTLAIGDEVAAGDAVTWTVAAEDPWGEGTASEPVTFAVVDPPEPQMVVVEGEEPRGCAVAGRPHWLLAALGALAWRRRSAR